jgi:hypothetical protein
VLVGVVLSKGSAVKQTLSARRKRLREAVRQRLTGQGWQECRANVYERFV